MKKNRIFRVASALCVTTVLMLGCDGSDDATPQSCENDIDDYVAALNAYISDQSVAKCQAFLNAANNVLDCPGITNAQRAEYEDAIEGVTCD